MSEDAESARLLVVEDERHLATGLKLNFEFEGYAVELAGTAREAMRKLAAQEPFSLIVLDVSLPDTDGFELCRRLRKAELPLEPLLLLVGPGQLDDLELRDDLFDDFCLTPFRPAELATRLHHLFWRTGRGTRPDLVEYGPLALNLETYQAAIDGEPLDLTYMEYELLKFLASHPGKVFTRETLLSRVWGYDYYGGARTVDVHVRRLRAKLGEQHAGLIHTVRSVGYRFGQSRWGV